MKEHRLSIPGRPKQNRVVEVMNRKFIERARSTRFQADMCHMLEGFFAETVSHVSYLVNMSPFTSIDF